MGQDAVERGDPNCVHSSDPSARNDTVVGDDTVSETPGTQAPILTIPSVPEQTSPPGDHNNDINTNSPVGALKRTSSGNRGGSNLSMESYFAHYHNRSPSSRRTLNTALPGSSQSSSTSLQGLTEHGGVTFTPPNIQRNRSMRSTPGHTRGRSVSSAIKPGPTSPPGMKRLLLHEAPFYPDQSFASTNYPTLPSRPHPVLRTRSSHPAQNLLYNDMSSMSAPAKESFDVGRRTADNTPISSPGLFTPTSVRNAQDLRTGSPQLHHLQTPRETNIAEVEHDTFSGNKFINNYEVVRELGRGEHGKVKLGRDIERDGFVAIKIVPRYSAKRRLGRLGAPEDRTKKEVAILKKARHPNVVSLLEVIDDPTKNKVYLILEYVDVGEIEWRKRGVREINSINNRRFELETRGVWLGLDPTDHDRHLAKHALLRHEQFERMQRAGLDNVPHWSLEYSGDTDTESESADISRQISRQLTNHSTPVRGNSLDDYVGTGEHVAGSSVHDIYGDLGQRKFSVAASAVSHMSSEHMFVYEDDQHCYVPALTLDDARRAFRDTLLGLEFLHSIRIIHRDIKPANLLVSSTGHVKISDFGVSYLGRPVNDDEAEHKTSEADAQALDDEKELARSVGTPAFWAPELCYEDTAMFEDGKEPKITGALDLWALGITLYCMIYARLPFYTTDQMGLHEAVCTAEVVCPRTRLAPVQVTPTDQAAHGKRQDFELKFETVPEDLRSLINLLLTKDPAKRITIAEAKRQPWVKQDVGDYPEWLQGPLAKEAKDNILEPNEKEMSHAVVKRTFIERALNTVNKVAGTLLGRKSGRDRASSIATSAGSSTESLSPTGSSASTIGKHDARGRDPRRSSLKGDELIHALKASREPAGEHPLAQSETASPEVNAGQPSYFEPLKGMPTSTAPASEITENRPRGPDRAISALSTADSIKTIRASQHPRLPIPEPAEFDDSVRTRVEGLWEGTAKTVGRLTSRDRHGSRSRSHSRPPSEHHGHAGPSLAVSNTYASGAIQTPNALRAVDAPPLTASVAVPSGGEEDGLHHHSQHPPVSLADAFEQAQQVNDRRLLQEEQDKADAARRPLEQHPMIENCPPSPDDLQYLISDDHLVGTTVPESGDREMQPTASASTIASSVEAFDNSSVSNRSHGIASGASSPPDHCLAEWEGHVTYSNSDPAFMRTADTVTTTVRGHIPVATGKSLQRELEDYEGDDDNSSDKLNRHNNDDYDFSDDDDDDLVMMGGPRRL